MAANFWRSSHWQQWILDRQDLIRYRAPELVLLTEEEYQKILIFFCDFLQALGQQLQIVREQVIATAIVYFRRFYCRNSFKSVDPLLLSPTAIYLASKVEECGVISNSKLIEACQHVVKNKFNYAFGHEFQYKIQHVLECEFYLLENMDCSLVVYQPYRPLVHLARESGHEEQLLPMARRMVNDSLRTDCCLMYPPYLIALACLQMACVAMQKDLRSWFSELDVDMEKLQEICRHVFSMYDFIKTYDEKKEIQGLLAKMPKPIGKPNRPLPPQNQGQDPKISTLTQAGGTVNGNQTLGVMNGKHRLTVQI